MKRIAAPLLIILCLAAITALAADVSGQWTAMVPMRGQTVDTTFTFKVEGAKLTGSITGPMGDTPISDGKVEGDNITFVQNIEAVGIKINYKGKVSGNSIEFTREVEGRGNPSSFTAKKK